MGCLAMELAALQWSILSVKAIWHPSFCMGSCLSLVPGARGSMMIQSSGAELPASGFWPPSFSNLKTTLSTLHRRQNPTFVMK